MGGQEDNSRTRRPSFPGLKHLENDLWPPLRASHQRRLLPGLRKRGCPQGQAEKGPLARASCGFLLSVQQAEPHPGRHLAPRPDPPGRSAQGQIITGDCVAPRCPSCLGHSSLAAQHLLNEHSAEGVTVL